MCFASERARAWEALIIDDTALPVVVHWAFGPSLRDLCLLLAGFGRVVSFFTIHSALLALLQLHCQTNASQDIGLIHDSTRRATISLYLHRLLTCS